MPAEKKKEPATVVGEDAFTPPSHQQPPTSSEPTTAPTPTDKAGNPLSPDKPRPRSHSSFC